MKNTYLKKIALLFVSGLFINLQSCKKDEPSFSDGVTPAVTAITPIAANEVSPAAIAPLYVSTTVYGTDKIPQPNRICSAPNGTMYMTSQNQGKVYKVSKNGTVTTVAAGLLGPYGIKAAKNGDIYVAVAGENRIIKINPSGLVSNVKVSISLNTPQDMAIADDGTLFIADTYNRRIVKVSPSNECSILAGKTGLFGIKDGLGTNAHFSYLSSIRLAADGFLWVIDGDGVKRNGHTIRRITQKGQVNTYFFQKDQRYDILDIAVKKLDKNLNPSPIENLFLVYQNNRITQLGTNGIETELSGFTDAGFTSGLLGREARFSMPTGITFNGNDIYIVDSHNHALRCISKNPQ
ncbi:NHL repeat-containing protein [Mucilaginibacter psychrotolerans]|uniref:NHL repeat-containing protein n=1 Tax=Mucilaginibacter psychrotolerans TaxID=1524096 RepID=A0A4Y8SLA1_9SPHI|nr:hypothetical protein [Mucilaginibacter psychrotolerans]TFF39813.1 hypothetical protein E2R66_05475 [Mucilaginibacter psychrotolerans]